MTFLFAILILMQSCARMATWPRQWTIWAAGVAVGISAWLLLPYAWESSLMALKSGLKSKTWEDNFVLLVSLEVLWTGFIGYTAYRKDHGSDVAGSWVIYMPSVLLFPSVFWMGAEFLNYFVGYPLWMSGLVVSSVLAIGMPLLAMLFRWALVKSISIIEFGFALSILLFLAVLLQPLVSASSPTHLEPIAWINLLTLGATCAAGIIAGMALFYTLQKLRIK